MEKKKPMEQVLQFCFFFLFFLCGRGVFLEMATAQKGKIRVNVGVVLDMDDIWLGKMGLSCISMAFSDFYSSHSHYKTRLVLHPRDSKNQTFDSAAAAVDLLKNVHVEAIIGPITSPQANFMISLGERTRVPTISFSATSPSLSLPQNPYFFRATLNDSSQVKAIGALVEAFGWKEVIPIYIENDYGKGILPCLIGALQEVNTWVSYQSAIQPSATDDQIVSELQKLKEMESKVFVVHTTYALGAKIFRLAKDVGMMEEGYAWILTDGITDFLTSMDSSVIEAMQGVVGVKPLIPKSKELENFTNRWKKKFQKDYPTVSNPELNVFGSWAYDAATALAMAVERVGYGDPKDDEKVEDESSKSSITELEALEVSKNGESLRKELLQVTFKGLSGDFHMIDGQLRSPQFQIVNVIGDKEREIGFWTPQNGIVRKLGDLTSIESSSHASSANLGQIIWPGFSSSPPSGSIRKLKIGVLEKQGYFVKAAFDVSTNKTNATGYAIEFFEAVMKAMPYNVPYELFAHKCNYDELIDLVYNKTLDAVIGDLTITAKRSMLVSFTLPFSESGVALVVPTKDSRPKTAWVFLKPLTWDLWVTSVILFTFVAFVIWVLEHRTNPEFGGSSTRQLSTSLWYSFSIMVFAHKEQVVSHLARFVVILWCFVVLILTQSYTASFTSMLTVQKLEPTITSVQELVRNVATVGYSNGSFVLEILKQRKFNNLKPYSNLTHLDQELTIGSAGGGFAAAFEETPYMKRFCAIHCPKYTLVEVIKNTSGFGFAFPKGSPLVADVSRAILHVKEGDKMKELEKWFPAGSNCDTSATTSSKVINLNSFGALFLIVFVSCSLSLIIFLAMLLYNNRQFLLHTDIRALLKKFLMMHTSSAAAGDGASGQNGIRRGQNTLGHNPTPFPSSPSAIAYDTDRSSREGSPQARQTPSQETIQDVQLAKLNHEAIT